MAKSKKPYRSQPDSQGSPECVHGETHGLAHHVLRTHVEDVRARDEDDQTPTSLGFGRKTPTAKWVVFTFIVLSPGVSFLIFVLTALQQAYMER